MKLFSAYQCRPVHPRHKIQPWRWFAEARARPSLQSPRWCKILAIPLTRARFSPVQLERGKMAHASIHSQHQSMLLSAPLEVRQSIYSHLIPRHIHVTLLNGKIQFSPCLQPNLGDNDHDGRERRSTDGSRFEDSKFPRRLRSTWGPHWECEVTSEVNVESPDNHSSSLLFVCKKM